MGTERTSNRLTAEDVQRLVEAGMSMERLEQLLQRVDLDAEQKAALWRSAWARTPRPGERRRIPGLYLG